MVTIATTEESDFVSLGLVAEESVFQNKIQSCRIEEDEFGIAGLYGRAPAEIAETIIETPVPDEIGARVPTGRYLTGIIIGHHGAERCYGRKKTTDGKSLRQWCFAIVCGHRSLLLREWKGHRSPLESVARARRHYSQIAAGRKQPVPCK
jgi:hypothetical protein